MTIQRDPFDLRGSSSPFEPAQGAPLGTPLSHYAAFLALFSVVLVRLPILATHHGNLWKLTVAMLFFVGAWRSRSVHADRAVNRGLADLLALYLIATGVVMFRGAAAGGYTAHSAFYDWLMIAALGIFAVTFLAGARQRAIQSRMIAVAFAPTVYVTVNVLLYLGRHSLPFQLPQSPAEVGSTTDEMLGLIGIHTGRIVFPLALGLNNFGMIASAGFAAATIVCVRSQSPRRSVSATAAAICLYGDLATDSRAPLLLALAVIALFLVTARLRTAQGLAIVIPLSPALVLASLSFFAGAGFLGGLSRQGGDLSTGNNRLYIWTDVIHFIEHANANLIFGYGGYGQVRSGVAFKYAYLFTDPRAYAHTAHNLALQTILDAGFVGLALLVAVVVAAVSALERGARAFPRSALPGVLALLLVTVLSGATEAVPSYLSPDTLALFVLLVGTAAGSRIQASG